MAEGTNSRGTLWLALLGYIGVIASAVTGLDRSFVIVFATVGILGYVAATTHFDRYLAYHIWLRWYTTRYHAWMGHSVQVQPPGPGFFYVRVFHGTKEEGPTEMPEKVKALLAMKDIRCELRQPWHWKKYQCGEPRWLRSSNYVTADVPQEITHVENGAIRLMGGPYFVRWKRNGRLRAIARCYVGFDETGYQRHFLRRVHFGLQKFRSKLQDESQWKQP